MSAIIDSNRSTRGIGDEGEEKKEDRDQRIVNLHLEGVQTVLSVSASSYRYSYN